MPTPDPAFATPGSDAAIAGEIAKVDQFLRTFPEDLPPADAAAVRGMSRDLARAGTLKDPAAVRDAARRVLPDLSNAALKRRFLVSIGDVTARLEDGDPVAAYREARDLTPAGAFTATAGLKEYDELMKTGRVDEARVVLAELSAEISKMPSWEKLRVVQRQAEQAIAGGHPETAVALLKEVRMTTDPGRSALFQMGGGLLAPLSLAGRDDLAADLNDHLMRTNPDFVTPVGLNNAWFLQRWSGDGASADLARKRLLESYPTSKEAFAVQRSLVIDMEQVAPDRMHEVFDALDFVEASGHASAADLELVKNTRKTIRTLRRLGIPTFIDGSGDLRPVPEDRFVLPDDVK